MKKTGLVLVFLLALALTFTALPGITAFAADNDGGADPSNAEFNADDAFVPGEVLAPADSWQQASDIAEAYGLSLKSYAYGVAVLAAPDPEEAVAHSVDMSMSVDIMSMSEDIKPDAGSRALAVVLPSLSLNMLYQTCEVAYDYDYQAVYDRGSRAAAISGGFDSKYERPALSLAPVPAGAAEAAPIFELFSSPHSFAQWHHNAMDTLRAWEISSGENVVVALIDTGIDIEHPDFAGRISAKSYNSHTDQLGIDYVIDDFGHGTHVSGIIAGALNDSAGVCGVAYSAQIMMIKANMPEAPGFFDEASLIRGINYAVQNGANVINMSLGRSYLSGEDEQERAAIANAVAQGVTVVCAAGNGGEDHASFPAAYPEAIAVSAIQNGLSFDYSYSNFGPEVDIAAPGTDVYSTAYGGGYMYLSGTSMAAPNVVGVAALIIALHPEYTPQQVRDVLRQTARDAGELGRDDYYGSGVVNAYGAVLGVDALYSVTFDFNDGVREPATVKATPGGILLETYAPQLAGYAFTGWYISGTDTLFNITNEVISKDISLYAKWAELKEGMFIVEFPDASFRRLVMRMLSADGRYRTDGTIIDQDDINTLASFTHIFAENMSIADMTGLKYFTGLEDLWCPFNSLTSLDVSANTALQYLTCYYNQLNALDVSRNTELLQLLCNSNPLRAIDVSRNPKLSYFDCYENQLNTLDVTHNPELETLLCDSNQLSVLDLSRNPALNTLWCDYNRLIALDVSNNPALEFLLCDNNRLSALDVSHNPALKSLWCNSNLLSAVDVSNNVELYHLWCSDNLLSAVDVSKNTDLVNLLCGDNQLRTLDVSQNTDLVNLLCSNNQLRALDVSQNTALAYLECYVNDLTMLDIANNPALYYMDCRYNRLESTDAVSGWQEIGLVLSDSFNFYPQKGDLEPGSFIEEFPDANFRYEVLRMLNEGYGGDRTDDSIISWNDIMLLASIYDLDVGDMGISDLTGLKYFSSLDTLWCYNNQITALDVSANTALRRLYIGSNQLSELDVSQNIMLEDLDCSYNQLSALDVSANTALMSLYCGDNQLSVMDVSENYFLMNFVCSYNQLRALDILGNKALNYLDCSGNQLSVLDVSGNTALLSLHCGYNQLSVLDVSQNNLLEDLGCFYNQLRALDVSGNSALISLNCGGNQLSILDVANNSALMYLYCGNNQLNELNVSQNNLLDSLECQINQLRALDVSGNQALTYLNCGSNQLSALRVTPNTKLRYLYCSNNQLSVLDVSQNSLLGGLDCGSNQLKALDVASNKDLYFLYCFDNQLSALDVSGNNALAYLHCGSNQLSVLDVAGNSELLYLYCDGNQLSVLDMSKNTMLQGLSCAFNQLRTLDVSGNKELNEINCYDNQLGVLDVSANTALTNLYCGSNQLSVLDLSRNSLLESLDCTYNQLQALDVSGSMALNYLNCYYNQISALDLPANAALTSLYCGSNQLSVLDVSKNSLLEGLDCSFNQLRALDVSGNTALIYINCSNNQLSALDVTNNTNLEMLYCTENYLAEPQSVLGWQEIGLVLNETFIFYPQTTDGGLTFAQAFPDPAFLAVVLEMPEWQGGRNGGDVISEDDLQIIARQAVLDVNNRNIRDLSGVEYFTGAIWIRVANNRLTTLDLSQNTALTALFCNNNSLEALDVKANTALTDLNCYANQLSALDLSENTELRTLHCWDNKLTEVDVSNNAKLYELYCADNLLTAVDVSQNTALLGLECENNRLTTLNVSQNTVLTFLDCSNNQLTELDVSKNTALVRLYCFDNQLSGLDVSNNAMLASAFGGFWCYNNYMTSPDNVKGWQQLGMVINSPDNLENGNFRYYNQLAPPTPIITITTQPVGGDAYIEGDVLVRGGTLTIAATVSNGAIPSYQWYQRLGASPDPATDTKVGVGAEFTIPVILYSGVYYYYCVVSAQDAASVISDVAALNVMVFIIDKFIIIISEPEDISVTEGSVSGSLSVEAKGFGGELTYQWYKTNSATNYYSGDAPIVGATSAVFTVPTDLKAAGSPYYYYCVVSEIDAVDAMSRIAVVSVEEPAPIITITTQPVGGEAHIEDGVLMSGGTLTIAAAVSNGAIPSYQWYQRLGANPDPATDTKVGVGANITIPIVWYSGKYYYYCVVSSPGAADVISDVAAVDVLVTTIDKFITIIREPEDIVVTEGSVSGSLSVEVKGFGGELSYRWYKTTSATDNNGGEWVIGATSATLDIPTDLKAAGSPYYFYCVIREQGAVSATSRIATVSVKEPDSPPAGITVNFPGIKGATVQYYTNVSGWVTVGKFDETCNFVIPDKLKATWGATTVQVTKGGMWHTFSNLNVGDDPLVVETPVKTITVSGITAACDLGIVQSDWVYPNAPAAVGVVNEFKVFDNGKKYEVRLSRPGFYPITITGVDAGQTINFGAAYFYQATVPAGVTNVWISSYDWAVRGANAGDPIVLLKDPANIRSAKMSYVYGGKTYNVEFKLDGSDPFK